MHKRDTTGRDTNEGMVRTGFWLRALAVFALFGGAAADCGPGISNLPDDAGAPPTEYDAVPAVVALAGADLHVLEGARVQLDGHGSRSLVSGEPVALTWSQVEGDAVVLTNPSGPSPAFVAPLSPSLLRFRLRAEVGEQIAFDEVTVVVGDSVGAVPFFVEGGEDRRAAPRDTVTLRPDVVGTPAGEVRFEAEARCLDASAVEVDGATLRLTLPAELPCLVFVEAIDSQGSRSGPAAVTFWPEDTPLVTQTRVLAPVVGEPSAELSLTFEGGAPSGEGTTRAWPAGGRDDGLASAQPGPVVSLQAPARRTRMVLGAERRRAGVSGGLRYTFVDVSAGFGNRAPVASGGADRRVRPGASFTLTTSASFDLDEDALTIDVVQVIGPAAERDEVQPGVFHAPDSAATLAFHVTAFDGVVNSEPDSVRVVIDPTIENEPPVLEVEPVRYVAPGRTFTLDASGAYDPDSGFLDRFLISQIQEDASVLLAEPVEEATVELVAGADGEVYNFRLSAFDEAGLAGSADVQVIVEEAGPYVDATLGDDELGNGTQTAPFASLEAAVEVARRHQLPELRLGAGPQQPFAGVIGDGLLVRGGFVWDGSEWAQGAERSELPVGAEGLTLVDATLSDLVLELAAADARVAIEGGSALVDVGLVEAPAHEGTFIDVGEGAIVALDRVTVDATTPVSGDATMLIARAGAAVRLTDAEFVGGAGGSRTALRCEGAFMDAIRTSVVAASGAQTAVAIDASDCDVQLLSSEVTGGTATEVATAVRATDTVLFVGPSSRLVGASLGASAIANAVVATGADAAVALAGTIDAVDVGATADRAVGVEALSSRVSLSAATVSAVGQVEAIGVRVAADRVQLSDVEITASCDAGRAVGVELADGVEDVSIVGATLTATGASALGVEASSTVPAVAPVLSDVTFSVTAQTEAAGLALHGSSLVDLRDCAVTVVASDADSDARAVGLGDGRIEDCSLHASATGEAFAVVLAAGDGRLDLVRSEAYADSPAGSAVGVLAGAQLEVSSSVLHGDGATAGVALDVLSDTTLRHGTLLGSSVGLRATSSSAALDLANSVFVAPTGVELTATSPMPTLARTLAFTSTVALIDGDGAELRTTGELEAAGCTNCRVVADALLDERGRIVADDAHPLVDQADPGFTLPWDVDGDTRPQGLAPDIGADELLIAP
jgi:hypothetical protein